MSLNPIQFAHSVCDEFLRYLWAALARVPYFVWISIAMVLQLSVAAMNQGR